MIWPRRVKVSTSLILLVIPKPETRSFEFSTLIRSPI